MPGCSKTTGFFQIWQESSQGIAVIAAAMALVAGAAYYCYHYRQSGQVQARFPGRKARTVFSDHQLAGLMQRFEEQIYLSGPEVVELATELNLTETQVQPKADLWTIGWPKNLFEF